jgi:threonine dehydrogenase-like Zn-dependent dehydrogenase
LDYLDLYLVHWPFPNYHPPGCDVHSRNPNAKSYIHENYMKTWRQMEKLVMMGLVRHIGTSNMTIPKLELLLRDAVIKPAVNEMELHPHFQQPELFHYVVDHGILPIGYCPLGSPNRPQRDRILDDTVDLEDPVIVGIAQQRGIHPAQVCIKWAIQRGQIPIPFSTKRRNYMISCTSEKYRRAYGWQRDGGMADYLLAEEKDLILLPDQLSYVDGAQVACGFGTAYEGLEKIGVSGNDAVLVTGLGPVGLATAMLCRAMGARFIIGIDVIEQRMKLAQVLGLCDTVLCFGPDNVSEVKKLTSGAGVERAIDCSANAEARATAIRATHKWGRILLLGEGGSVAFNPSPDMIHDQKTLYASWVTSTWKTEELVERLVRWNLHPEKLVTHWFALNQVAEAYALAASGKCGKVAVCFDEELQAS